MTPPTTWNIDGRILELTLGDITRQEVDAIVNAANPELKGGGGVDGAIHRAGGPSILEECRKLGGCPAGQAVATRAGKLKARYVIHAVGPIYHGHPEDPKKLASAYRESLLRAEELRLACVAFPSLSTGTYGYPVTEAALVALEAVAGFLGERACSVKRVRFVLFSEPVLRAYQEALAELAAR